MVSGIYRPVHLPHEKKKFKKKVFLSISFCEGCERNSAFGRKQTI